MIRLPLIIIVVLSTVGAFILPRKYESTTTILVQKDETLNPLISYEMAVNMASEDRLRTFNEIIYSRPILETLIDSLGLRSKISSDKEKEELIKDLKSDIKTERGGDSYTITVVDTRPDRAKKAVTLLSELFIKTRLQVEHQRDEQTVDFFENKLEDLRQKFEQNQKQVVGLLRQRIEEMPRESHTMYTQMDEIDKQMADIDTRLKTYQREVVVLRSFPEAFKTANGKQALYDLQLTDLPFTPELHTLLSKYDEYSQRYTSRYPDVQKLEAQIMDILERMRKGVESEFGKLQTQSWTLQKRRGDIINDIKQSSVTQRMDQDKESDYGIYQKLFDEMKVKLEQARTTRDLGKKAADQFIIIDPARMPIEPSKPNRVLIILGGLGLGIIMGILSAAAAEILDTRIRSPRDVEDFHKPIIAFIPETIH